jgi:membrane protein implicated in regulation of membrane protease activity
MIALGILLCLYAVGSAVLPLLGKQFGLLVWLEWLVPAAQWTLRGVVLTAGVTLVVLGWRARRGKAGGTPTGTSTGTPTGTPTGNPPGLGDGAGEEA